MIHMYEIWSSSIQRDEWTRKWCHHFNSFLRLLRRKEHVNKVVFSRKFEVNLVRTESLFHLMTSQEWHLNLSTSRHLWCNNNIFPDKLKLKWFFNVSVISDDYQDHVVLDGMSHSGPVSRTVCSWNWILSPRISGTLKHKYNRMLESLYLMFHVINFSNSCKYLYYVWQKQQRLKVVMIKNWLIVNEWSFKGGRSETLCKTSESV